MIKLQEFSGGSLTNNSDFQLKTEFRDKIIKFGAEELGIKKQFEGTFMPAYNKMDEANRKIPKSAFTEMLHTIDVLRDNAWIGLTEIVRANLYHHDNDIIAAAKRIKIKTDTFGNVAKLTMNAETAAITNFVQDFAPASKNLADAKLLRIEDWIEELDRQNKEFDRLMKERFEESASKTGIVLKDARKELDAATKMLISVINALVIINADDAAKSAKYEQFINVMNVIIAKYIGKHHKTNGDSSNSGDNTGNNGGEEEKYPNAREWSADIDYQTCASGDIFYIIRNGVKEYYKLLDFGEVATFEPGMDDGGIWEKLS